MSRAIIVGSYVYHRDTPSQRSTSPAKVYSLNFTTSAVETVPTLHSVSTRVGPLFNTVIDFWRLIWQKNVHVVSMLTNVIELGQRKCEQYWPDSGSGTYGPFQVTLSEERVFADYTIRSLQLQVQSLLTVQCLTLYQPMMTYALLTFVDSPYLHGGFNFGHRYSLVQKFCFFWFLLMHSWLTINE